MRATPKHEASSSIIPNIEFRTATQPARSRQPRKSAQTYPLLGQLSRPLVLAIPQQFDDSSLVRCETSDFLDDFTDEGCALGEVALGAGDAWFALNEGCLLVETSCQYILRLD
jgi:hypothetical protein